MRLGDFATRRRLAGSLGHLSSVYSLVFRPDGKVLLTATPEQLGVESHFARLRLLDGDRYRDLATFKAEEKDYTATARVAEKLLTRPIDAD